MKRLILLLIIPIIICITGFSKTYVLWFHDWTIKTKFYPVIENGSIVSWKTRFELFNNQSNMDIGQFLWMNTDTDPLAFDINIIGYQSDRKNEFVITSSSWLEAQQIMFKVSHQMMERFLRQWNLTSTIEFGEIKFTATDGTQLINTSDGIPNGGFKRNNIIH